MSNRNHTSTRKLAIRITAWVLSILMLGSVGTMAVALIINLFA